MIFIQLVSIYMTSTHPRHLPDTLRYHPDNYPECFNLEKFYANMTTLNCPVMWKAVISLIKIWSKMVNQWAGGKNMRQEDGRPLQEHIDMPSLLYSWYSFSYLQHLHLAEVVIVCDPWVSAARETAVQYEGSLPGKLLHWHRDRSDKRSGSTR